MDTSQTIEAIAHHEAGHLEVALSLNAMIFEIRLHRPFSGDKWHGRVVTDATGRNASIIAMAGPIAETIFRLQLVKDKELQPIQEFFQSLGESRDQRSLKIEIGDGIYTGAWNVDLDHFRDHSLDVSAEFTEAVGLVRSSWDKILASSQQMIKSERMAIPGYTVECEHNEVKMWKKPEW